MGITADVGVKAALLLIMRAAARAGIQPGGEIVEGPHDRAE